MDNDILKSNYTIMSIALTKLKTQEDFVRNIVGSTPHIWNNIKNCGKEGKKAFIKPEAIKKIHDCTGLRYDVLKGEQYLKIKNIHPDKPEYFKSKPSQEELESEIKLLIENFDSESLRKSYTKEFVGFIDYIKNSFRTEQGKTREKALEVKDKCITTMDEMYIDLAEMLSIKELEEIEKVLNNNLNMIRALWVIKKEKLKTKN